jgi:hypothetical protein
MEESLRPDLSRILPRPLLRRSRDPLQLGAGLDVREAAPRGDFFVEVDRQVHLREGDTGFGLQNARAVAAHVARHFAARPEPPPLHEPDAERSRRLLFGS